MQRDNAPNWFSRWVLIVLGAQLDPASAILLLHLGSFADYETGDNCRPTLAQLQERAQVSRATLLRRLETLELAGWLARLPGHKGRATHYSLQTPGVSPCNPSHPATRLTMTPVSTCDGSHHETGRGLTLTPGGLTLTPQGSHHEPLPNSLPNSLPKEREREGARAPDQSHHETPQKLATGLARLIRGELVRYERQVAWPRCQQAAERLVQAAPEATEEQLGAYLLDALADLGSSKMSDYGVISKLEKDAVQGGALASYLEGWQPLPDLSAEVELETPALPVLDAAEWQRRQDERAARWQAEALETSPALASQQAEAETARMAAEERRQRLAQVKAELGKGAHLKLGSELLRESEGVTP